MGVEGTMGGRVEGATRRGSGSAPPVVRAGRREACGSGDGPGGRVLPGRFGSVRPKPKSTDDGVGVLRRPGRSRRGRTARGGPREHAVATAAEEDRVGDGREGEGGRPARLVRRGVAQGTRARRVRGRPGVEPGEERCCGGGVAPPGGARRCVPDSHGVAHDGVGDQPVPVEELPDLGERRGLVDGGGARRARGAGGDENGREERRQAEGWLHGHAWLRGQAAVAAGRRKGLRSRKRACRNCRARWARLLAVPQGMDRRSAVAS